MIEMTDVDARHHISTNIARLLAARSMKPLHLAEAVKESSTQNTIYRIVRGDTCGTVPILAAIAEELGVTIDYLITDPEEHAKKHRTVRKHVAHSA
ncbi:helix-turn-helix domain-containing protein [Planctomicrobium sp. SH661]|uniref:helix-turn-helix domain-containing protein n=1 Tax=Planctomicrobium sp. SH661 TaxID=3448124 RepID=UPI003F5B45B3